MPMTIGNSDTLFIRIGEDKIVFARYDRIKESTLNYSCFPIDKSVSLNANMHKALAGQPLAKGDFTRVAVLVDCRVVLVPLNEFDDDEMDLMYKYNMPQSYSRHRVFYDMLPLQNAVMLGSVDKDLEHTVLEAFPNAMFHSALMPLLLHFSSLCSRTDKAGKAFATWMGENLVLMAFRKGEISLTNTYEKVGGKSNALYFLLSFLRQWNVVPERDEVYLAGWSEKNEETERQLAPYMPNTFRLEPEKEFNRHVLALTKDLSYDMVVMLLNAY